MRAVKAIMTYYDCQMGETGNECFKEETFLPSILLSSSPVLPLWSLSQSAVCHVLISVFFIAYCGLGECHSATEIPTKCYRAWRKLRLISFWRQNL